MQEKRRRNRSLCYSLVELGEGPLTPGEKSITRKVLIEDISAGGMLVQSDEPLSCGATVTARYELGQLPGVIRHCFYHGGTYFAGVEFSQGCQWSADLFRPKYLLDKHKAQLTLPAQLEMSS